MQFCNHAANGYGGTTHPNQLREKPVNTIRIGSNLATAKLHRVYFNNDGARCMREADARRNPLADLREATSADLRLIDRTRFCARCWPGGVGSTIFWLDTNWSRFKAAQADTMTADDTAEMVKEARRAAADVYFDLRAAGLTD